jgi:hypothetical protein
MYGLVLFESSIILSVPPLMLVLSTDQPPTVKTPAFVSLSISVVLFLTTRGSEPPNKTLPLSVATSPNLPVEAVRSPLTVTLPDVSTEKFVVGILSTVLTISIPSLSMVMLDPSSESPLLIFIPQFVAVLPVVSNVPINTFAISGSLLSDITKPLAQI